MGKKLFRCINLNAISLNCKQNIQFECIHCDLFYWEEIPREIIRLKKKASVQLKIQICKQLDRFVWTNHERIKSIDLFEARNNNSTNNRVNNEWVSDYFIKWGHLVLIFIGFCSLSTGPNLESTRENTAHPHITVAAFEHNELEWEREREREMPSDFYDFIYCMTIQNKHTH